MNNIKDYREKELKNYVIGNVLFFLVFSGKIQKIILLIYGVLLSSQHCYLQLFIYTYFLWMH